MIAFLIPIHPSHYRFIYNIRSKIINASKEVDFYFIFSSESDYEKFLHKDIVKKIIVEIPSKYEKSIVTYKKFQALKRMSHETKYEYFILCDSEIDIIEENFTKENIQKKMDFIFNNKKIFGGEVVCKLAKIIIKHSISIFKKDEDKSILKKKVKEDLMYYWFSDIPVYKREHLEDFFSKINHDNLEWYHFDHKIYLNYLLLYHNFNLVNLTELIDYTWSLECMELKDKKKLELLKDNKYSYSWIIPKMYEYDKEYFIKNGTFLLYHLDRPVLEVNLRCTKICCC